MADDAADGPPALQASVIPTYPPRPIPYAAFNMPVANIYGDPSLMTQAPPGMPMPPGGYMPPGMSPQMQPDMQSMQGMQGGGTMSGPVPDGSGSVSACGPNGCDADMPWDAQFFRRMCAPIDTDLWNDVHCHHRFYGTIDVLAWWTRGNPTPPLITTSPPGTPQAQAGVLGQPNTSILYGDQRIDSFIRSGARINIGYNLVDGEFWAIEGHYLALANSGTDFTRSDNFTNGPGNQILARPFFNTQTGLQDSGLVAFPNFNLNGTLVNLDGSINVHSTTNLQSAGALLKHLLWIDFTSQWRLDLLGGYRLLRADDSVTINDAFTTSGGLLAPTTFTSTDVFGAHNTFNGGEIGVNLQKRMACTRLSWSSLFKIAFGNVHEKVTISGVNSISTLGTTVTTPGGFLTQPTNIGTYTRNQFGVLPEVQFNLAYDLTQNWRFLTGYTFLYLNHVQRSGSTIDTTLNPTQLNGGTLVGAARPAFAFSSSSYWAQGLNFGLEYRW